MERRPHWTDDLIEAVGREAWGYMFNPVMGHIRADQEEAMSEQCGENPILARARTAIENGEAVNRVSALVARIEELEAAIERARERAGGPIPAVHGDWMAGYAAAMRDILSALGHDIEMEGKR